jgi:UDP-glucuronate 4-epimerase
VYGPRQRPDLAVRKFAELILQERPIPVFGDGSSARDYTYVDDIVAGVLSAIDYRESMYEIINLGNHQALPLLDVIRIIEGALKRRAVLSAEPNQPGDVPYTCADIRKAKTLLNYEPHTKFDDGIERFVNWLKSERVRESSSPLLILSN